MTTVRRKRRNLIDRIALTGFVSIAIAGLFLTATWAGDHGGKHHARIMVAGHGADGEDLDISDLAVGETRFWTTESGSEMEITRTENGYELKVDGKDISVNTASFGLTQDVFVHAEGEGGDQRTITVLAGDDGEAGTWVSEGEGEGHALVEIEGLGGSSGITISGLGDLDDFDKERIIDAIRDAGIEKDVHFAPTCGSGFHFVTAGADGDGAAIRKQIKLLGDPDGAHKSVFVIRTESDEEDDE